MPFRKVEENLKNKSGRILILIFHLIILIIIFNVLNLRALDDHSSTMRTAGTSDLAKLVLAQQAVEFKVESLKTLLFKMQVVASAQIDIQTSVDELAGKVELIAINQAVILKCISEILLRTGSTQPDLQTDIRITHRNY